jgi:hypothetical protein
VRQKQCSVYKLDSSKFKNVTILDEIVANVCVLSNWQLFPNRIVKRDEDCWNFKIFSERFHVGDNF